MKECQKVTKSCGTCGIMCMASNEPVDDDTVCYCGLDNRYLCYPDEMYDECPCEKWLINDEAKELLETMNKYVEEICKTLSNVDNTENQEWHAMIEESMDVIRRNFALKEFPASKIKDEDVEGHTKYLQGINLPIYVNSIYQSNGITIPSEVCEMHIGKLDNGEEAVLITPEIVSVPENEDYPEIKETLKSMIWQAVQRELRFDSDHLTKEGFDFIEQESPKLIIKKILIDVLPSKEEAEKYIDEFMFLSDYVDITLDIDMASIEAMLQEVISDYVSKNGNIRIYED